MNLSTGVEETSINSEGIQLSQNYPYPIIKNTTIKYSLPVAGRYQIKVYDLQGNEMATLLDE